MSDSSDAQGTCSLHDPRVRTVLDRLHRLARAQTGGLARLVLSRLSDRLARRERSLAEEAEQVKDLYICLSPKQGTFAYMVARSLRARRVVEFGTSFGVSTIYLAAAVRDNGGGLVIGSEIEPCTFPRASARPSSLNSCAWSQLTRPRSLRSSTLSGPVGSPCSSVSPA